MKIAILVDNNSMETGICMSFGRTPWFLIYDTVTEEKNLLIQRICQPGRCRDKSGSNACRQ